MQTGQVTGNTLLLDFPFQAFPENMGHWAEILAPAYSVLSAGRWREHVDANSSGQPHLDAVLLVNLRREQLQVSGCDVMFVEIETSLKRSHSLNKCGFTLTLHTQEH